MADGPLAEPEPRHPRVSRPTPTHLFQQRQEEGHENGGGQAPRPTRVIPALAGGAAAEETPAPPAPVPDREPVMDSVPARRDSGPQYPPDIVFIVRADGTVLYINRPLGLRGEEDVIGTDLFEWVVPDQHTVIRSSLDRVFNRAQADGLDLHGIQEHDANAWYECRISPNLRDGVVVSATIIARDVTRYKRNEQILQEEHAELTRLLEERTADLEQAKGELAGRVQDADQLVARLRRFRDLMDAAGEAVFVTDVTTGRLVDVNETASRWLRTSRDALVGHDASTLGLEFQILPPETLDLQFTETRDSRRPLILDGGVHRRADGSTFPVEVAVARHTQGENEYVLAVVRDVKGRRWAEEALRETQAHYRALFEQCWDPIYVTTRAGRIVEANPAAIAAFGYPADDFIGLDARALLPRAEDIRAFQREMAANGVVRNLKVQVRMAAGDQVAGRLSALPRRDQDGGLQGYQWLVRLQSEVRPAEPGEPPEAVPQRERRPQGTVLVVDRSERIVAEARSALEHAGLRVLTADDPDSGVAIYRDHRRDIAAVLIGTAVGDPGSADAARSVRAEDDAVPIVLLSPDDPYAVAERFADVRLAAHLRKPVHPLTLVQTMRDLVAAPAGGAARGR